MDKNQHKKINLNRSIVDISDIIKIEENSQCVDCYRTDIHYIDLNYAVFICSNCAETHKLIFDSLLFNIVEVDENRKAKLTEKEIKLLKIGGNKNFRDLMSLYHCKEKRNDIIDKYLNKATIYYVKLISSKLNNYYLKEDKPSLNDGPKLVDKNMVEKEIIELYNYNKELI